MDEDTTNDHTFMDCLMDYRFYAILLVSSIVIGNTAAFVQHLDAIKRAQRHLGSTDSIYNTYMLSEALGALICGLLAFFFRFDVNQFFFGIVGATLSILGYLICEFFDSLYVSSVFIAGSSGIWWVIAPILAYDYFGPKSFAGVWGSIFTANFFGMVAANAIFNAFWTGKDGALYAIIIIYFFASSIAVAIAAFVLKREQDASK